MNTQLDQSLQTIQQLFQQGQIDKAASLCRQTAKRFTKQAEPYVILARIEQARGHFAAMNKAFKQACKRLPKEVSLYAMHGDACMEAQHFAEAIVPYRKGLGLQPKQLAWRTRLACALQELDEGIDEAIDLHQSVVDAAPKETVAHYNLGTAFKRKRLFDKALSCYRESVALAPNDVEVQFSLANLLFEIEQYEEAVVELEKLTKLRPDFAVAYEKLSYCNKRLMRADKSVKFAERYIELVGKTSESLSLLASAQLSAGDNQKALATCELGLQKNPRNRRILSDKTIALSALGHKAEAQSLFNLDSLLHVGQIETPKGYDNLSQFNQDLMTVIDNHPTLDFAGVSHSCHQGATSDELFTGLPGPLQHLINAIKQSVTAYRNSIDNNNEHPWTSHLPKQSLLNLSGWVTKLRSQGYQHGHMHPTGWISGVYYLSLPTEVGGVERAGCIEFGRSPFFYPESDQGDIKVVEPKEGTLVLFPSYFYHRTIPFTSEQQRITIAFDFRTDDFS